MPTPTFPISTSPRTPIRQEASLDAFPARVKDPEWQIPRDKTSVERWINSFFSAHPEHDRKDPDKNFVVLTLSGSFNPVHKGHIEMLDAAKKEMDTQFTIDEQGRMRRHVVIGFLLVPRSQDEVTAKFFNRPNEIIFNEAERHALCMTATQKRSNYMVLNGASIADEDGCVELDVGRELQRKHSALRDLHFYMVWGEDFFVNHQNGRLWKSIASRSIVVPRPGCSKQERGFGPAPCQWVTPNNAAHVPNCSSTDVRFFLKNPTPQDGNSPALKTVPKAVRKLLFEWMEKCNDARRNIDQPNNGAASPSKMR